MAQLGQWYPPSLLTVLLPPVWSANLLLLLHLFWAGWGMRWLAVRCGAGAFAAAFAGIAYAFNGVTLSSLIWTAYIPALAWVPWLVGSLREAWRHGGRWIVAGAIGGAMQILSGMPEITVLTWVFIAMLWINELCLGEIKLGISLSRTAGVVALAAGLSMVQVLPFLDLLSHSQRNEQSSTGAWSMPGWGWANLLVPLFHCYQAADGQWFQYGQDMLQSYYLGAGVISLAVVGACFGPKRYMPALVTMALLCLIMALGSNGLVYDWARHIFPTLGYSRFPLKFVILAAFVVPLLAASGVDHISERPTERVSGSIGIIFGVMISLMGALVWFARKYPLPYDQWKTTALNTLERALLLLLIPAGLLLAKRLKMPSMRLCAQIAVLACLPLDALTHCPNIAPTLPDSVLAAGMWQASGKPAPPKLGDARIMISPAAEQQIYYRHTQNLLVDLGDKRLAEWYNFNLLDMIPKVNGAVTLHPANFDSVERRLYYTSGGHFGPGLLDFLSVAWFSSDEYPFPYTARTNYLPVLSGGQHPVLASDAQALEGIMAADYDPHKIIYLADSDRPFVTEVGESHCEFHNVAFKPHRIEADVAADKAALIVLSQTYYHLWQPWIDGKLGHLLRANVAFQALEVPAGKHHIRFEYRDRNFILGLVLSVLSVFACGVVWVRCSSR